MEQGGARGAAPLAARGARAETLKPPPRSHRRKVTGDRRRTTGSPGATPPPSSPSPPLAGGRAEAGQGDVGPAPPPPPPGQARPPPPRGPRHPGRSATGPVRRAPLNHRPPTHTVTSTGLQSCAATQGHCADRIWAAARGHEPEQRGDHALHGLGEADEACLGAQPREAEGGTEAERPPAPRPPGPANHALPGRAAHRPPLPPPPARAARGRA